jgi:hypothetical protein
MDLTQRPELLSTLNLIVCLAATVFMTGVIWVIQVVHYPLFAQVGDGGFFGYHTTHSQRISLVVILPMLVELGTSLLLVMMRPRGVPMWAALLGAALVGIVWVSTFFLQVPYHNQLGAALAEERSAAITGLVVTNWIRTVAWTIRSVLMLGLVAALVYQ